METLFIRFSKELLNLDQFLLLLFLGAVVLLWTKWQKTGCKMMTGLALLMVVIVIMPWGRWAVTYLENRFERLAELPADVTGIILLGGSFEYKVTESRHVISYNMAASRIIEFVELAHRYPEKHLVFSGGGDPRLTSLNEARLTQSLLAKLGLDTRKIIFENRSIDTIQNAAFTSQILQPKPQEKWVLVTSAFHMPRAVGLFRKVGFNVIPYPVDYRTTGLYDFRLSLTLQNAILDWKIALRELGGLTLNYLKGRSDQWISH